MQRKGGVKKSRAEERVRPQRLCASAWAGVALPGGRSAWCCGQWQLRWSSGWAAVGWVAAARTSGDEAEREARALCPMELESDGGSSAVWIPRLTSRAHSTWNVPKARGLADKESPELGLEQTLCWCWGCEPLEQEVVGGTENLGSTPAVPGCPPTTSAPPPHPPLPWAPLQGH